MTSKLTRRQFIQGVVATGLSLLLAPYALAASGRKKLMIEKIHKTDNQWQTLLTPEQYQVLRKEGTEPPFSSKLNNEYGRGNYVCAGCDLPLFSSEAKFNSGTGWPSFFAPIEKHTETSRDFKMILPRTEYHCARCGGHQGHIFNDGPEPTGQRWCNNGIALKFIPA